MNCPEGLSVSTDRVRRHYQSIKVDRHNAPDSAEDRAVWSPGEPVSPMHDPNWEVCRQIRHRGKARLAPDALAPKRTIENVTRDIEHVKEATDG